MHIYSIAALALVIVVNFFVIFYDSGKIASMCGQNATHKKIDTKLILTIFVNILFSIANLNA